MLSLRTIDAVANDKTRSRTARAQEELADIFLRQRKPIRRLTAISLVLRLAPLLVPIALRFTLGPILDQSPLHTSWGMIGPRPLLGLLIATGCCAALVRGIANYFFVSVSGRCGHSLVADLRVAMFEHILRLPASYMHNRGTGKVLLRFIGDSDALRVWFSRTMPTVVADRFLLLVLSMAMITISPMLSLVVIVPTLLTLLAILLLTPPLRQRTRAARSRQASFTGNVETFLNSIAYAKWLAGYREAVSGVWQTVDYVREGNVRREHFAAVVRMIGSTLSFAPIPLVGWLGIQAVWNGTLEAGQFVAMTWLAVHTAVALQHLAIAAILEAKSLVSVQRVLRLLERSAEPGRSSSLRKNIHIRTSVVFRDMILKPDASGLSSSALSIRLEPDTSPTLLSKSEYRTIFEALMGLRSVESGEILIDGIPANAISVRSIRRRIGWYAESPLVVDGSILDNIRIAKPGASRRQIEKNVQILLETDTNASDWLSRPAGPNGGQLSSPDVDSLQLARIMLRQPELLFIDVLDSEGVLQRLKTAGIRIGIVCAVEHRSESLRLPVSQNSSEVSQHWSSGDLAVHPAVESDSSAETAD